MEFTITEEEAKEKAKYLLKLKISIGTLLMALDCIPSLKKLAFYPKLIQTLKDCKELVDSSLNVLVALSDEGATHGTE